MFVCLFLAIIFIYLLITVLGLCFCAGFSPVAGHSPVAVHGLLTAVASLVASTGSRLYRLHSGGTWAELLLGMWDSPGSGL